MELGRSTASSYAEFLAADPSISALGDHDYQLSTITPYAAGPQSHMSLLQVVELRKSGADILIFVDDSIDLGRQNLRCRYAPRIPDHALAAVASIRQARIAQIFENSFSQHGIITAQLIVDTNQFSSPELLANLVKTIKFLLEIDAIPILIESLLGKSITNNCCAYLQNVVMNALING